MALIKSNVLFAFLVILVAVFGVAVGGTVHKVGDSKGWTMMGVDYEGWSSSRTFQVGDSLVFEYNNKYHDVTEVTPHDFELCDPSQPLAKYQTGSDTVKLTKPRFHHFICGAPGHCDIGQKLDILILPASLGPSTTPVPRPVRSSSSSSSLSPTNAPKIQQRMAPPPLKKSDVSKSVSWIGSIISLLALILAF